MEEILKRMDKTLSEITEEDIKNMTSEEKEEFLTFMEKLEARVNLIDNLLGGE